MAADCGLTGTAKLNRCSAYCTISIISEVEYLTAYEDGDCDIFEKSLKKYYFDLDPQQKEYQILHLRSLAELQRRPSAEDLKVYATQYKNIAKVLIGDGSCHNIAHVQSFMAAFRKWFKRTFSGALILTGLLQRP